ncbi:hypothetical protein B0T17DRAFT_621122 [Bombardia bombarda]|uniref:Uncharacterized protein n=1 Tax=Bombardia bombarda TaxID=252184 RepID=A0AA39TH04_9PEZI|nr:hypothetical protein B0T17DRAFT_621122 [Bombardia bombarda]
MVASRAWTQLYRLFGDDMADDEQACTDMLARISGFRPYQTILEISCREEPRESEGDAGDGVSEVADDVLNGKSSNGGPHSDDDDDEENEDDDEDSD